MIDKIRYKTKSKSGGWIFYDDDEYIIEENIDITSKCKEVYKDNHIRLFESDILQTKDNDKVIVLNDSLVKVLTEEDNLENSSNKEEGFFMKLDNFLKYNSFQCIGNKFDFKKEK